MLWTKTENEKSPERGEEATEISLIPEITAGAGLMGILFTPFFGSLARLIRCAGFVIRPDIINLLTVAGVKKRLKNPVFGFGSARGLASGHCSTT